MILEHMVINKNSKIKEAIQKLEQFRCKNVYVVDGMKLLAAISDGDARRFLLRNGNIEDTVDNIANYSPTFYFENEIEKAKTTFERTELQSIPILNYNKEIVSILFRNDVFIKRDKKVNIPVVIMAGGKGSRLYPYTKILPKALIPIGEIPIVEHIINRLYRAGCQSYYMILNHKKDMVKAYFEGIDKEYKIEFVEEQIPMGTGGGLSLLKDKISEDFVLSNCDIIIDSDFLEILEFHKSSKNFITIVAAKKCDRIPYGVLQLDEENNYKGVLEKPSNNYLINTGFYIVNSRIIAELIDGEPIDFPSIIEKYKLIGEKIGVYCVEEKAFMDMGQLEELEDMRQQLGV